ncbi:MAG: hypothetical protein R3285_10710, partial [Kiloniellales bacterium]|nr:hypothetical protein [Kiloniellales bacterium]
MFALGLLLSATGAWPTYAVETATGNGQPGQTAALPHIVPMDEAGRPLVLSVDDMELYREIFRLQQAGHWSAADRLLPQIGDQLLIGHVLFQRYMHPTAYRSRFAELRDWLVAYADHPGADRIFRLAERRRPAGAARPHSPQSTSSGLRSAYSGAPPYRSIKRLSANERRRAQQILRQVRRNVLRTRLSVTERLLETREAQRLLDSVEIDRARAEVARGWYHHGRNDKAYALAAPAAERSGRY